MDTILLVCNDPLCQIQSKLIRNLLDEVEHGNHRLINLEQLKEDLTKINHPMRQVLKLSNSGQVLENIDTQSNRILQIFKVSLDEVVKHLKAQINQFAQEATEMKQVHDYLFSYHRLQLKQNDLFKGLHKLNSNYLQNFLSQVSRTRLEPFKILDDYEEKVRNFCQLPTMQEKQLVQDVRKNPPKKFKNTTKSEADLIKQLLTESGQGITELEIDLLGQMVNRQELLMPNKVFGTIKQFKKLQILKLSLSSTTIQDLGDLSRTISSLTDLTSLSLALGNTKVHIVNDLGKALGHLKQLEILELYLWSSNVSDISEIGKGIAQMRRLKSFEIQLGNTFVSDVAEVGKGISENKNIKKFFMNLEFTKVQEISELGWAIHSIRSIEEFELHLIDTLVHPRIRKNFYNSTHFSNEWKQLTKNPASKYK